MRHVPAMLLAASMCALPGHAAAAEHKPQALRLDGTPSVFADGAGRISACGLRVFGVEPLPPPRTGYRTVDLSILLGLQTVAQGIGMVKASSFETTAAALKANLPTRPFKVSDGWLRVPGSERTTAVPGKPLAPDSEPGAHRYLAAATALYDVADAVLEGKEIQVSVVREGVPSNPVYAGVVRLAPGDRQKFVACMRDLQKQAEEGTDAQRR